MALQHSIDSALQHFITIPWCNTLLRHPSVVLFTPPCRGAEIESKTGQHQSQDALFSQTWNSATTIPHVIGFHQRIEAERHSLSPPLGQQRSPQRLLVGSISLVFQLEAGLKGFNNPIHGGVLMSVMDEAMGTLIFVNHQQCLEMKKSESLPADVLDTTSAGFVTAKMDVRLQKPLIAPNAVVVTATLDVILHRKLFIDVSVTGKDGVVYAKCAGLWISIPAQKL